MEPTQGQALVEHFAVLGNELFIATLQWTEASTIAVDFYPNHPDAAPRDIVAEGLSFADATVSLYDGRLLMRLVCEGTFDTGALAKFMSLLKAVHDRADSEINKPKIIT